MVFICVFAFGRARGGIFDFLRQAGALATGRKKALVRETAEYEHRARKFYLRFKHRRARNLGRKQAQLAGVHAKASGDASLLLLQRGRWRGHQEDAEPPAGHAPLLAFNDLLVCQARHR